jgi:hypothetical protein
MACLRLAPLCPGLPAGYLTLTTDDELADPAKSPEGYCAWHEWAAKWHRKPHPLHPLASEPSRCSLCGKGPDGRLHREYEARTRK